MNSEGEKVLYSDGSLVTVTESMIQVKKSGYRLEGITKYGLSILQPVRLPWVLLIGTGLGMVIAGATKTVPASWFAEGYLDDVLITGNLLAILTGIVLVLTGVGFLLSLGERYAVSITTAEGEQNVVVSRRKEYVTCIVNALNSAFFARLKQQGDKRVREYTVSSR